MRRCRPPSFRRLNIASSAGFPSIFCAVFPPQGRESRLVERLLGDIRDIRGFLVASFRCFQGRGRFFTREVRFVVGTGGKGEAGAIDTVRKALGDAAVRCADLAVFLRLDFPSPFVSQFSTIFGRVLFFWFL